MGKEEELKGIIKLITWWIAEIKANDCVGFYDINMVAEDLALELLNEIYGYQLENLNYEKNNYPGIDLGDKVKKIGFQITSRRDTQKIEENLRTFVNKSLKDYSNGIRFFILTLDKKAQLSNQKYRGIYPDFDPGQHIKTANDLIKEIRRIYDTDRDKFYRIKEILEKEVGHITQKYHIQANILHSICKKIIKEQIKTVGHDKYIPDVYVERKIEQEIKSFIHCTGG